MRMLIRPETESFLQVVEQHARQRFRNRADVALLYEAASTPPLQQVFFDITFQAKFVTHAVQILKRVGAGSDDAQRLGIELNQALEKVSTLLRTLVKELPEETKQEFVQRYLSLSQEGMANLLPLLSELQWIKNYQLDRDREG